MICPNCKQEIDNIGFCPLCGYEIVPNYFSDGKNLETKDMPTQSRVCKKKCSQSIKDIKRDLETCITGIGSCIFLCLLGILSIFQQSLFGRLHLHRLHTCIALVPIIPIMLIITFILLLNIITLLKPLKGSRIKTLIDVFKNLD